VGKTSFFNNADVVTPGWVRIVDIARDELLKELETDSKSTGTRKRLNSDDLEKFMGS